jgi:CubicO group peptidase (beta-lactamase class C family)
MRADEFRDMVMQARTLLSVPSVVAAVAQGGEVVYCTSGHRGLLGGAVNEHTVYPIASASKAFIATCVMMLVDEGTLELDAPVRRYLPQFELFTPELTEQLTIRDMLSHRSGLPRHDATLFTRADATLAETVDYMRWLEPCWDLRERFYYQNHMFALASLLVERVSGKPWAEVVRERVFAPLGMTRAYTAWRAYERYDSNYAYPLDTRGLVSVPIPTFSLDALACAGSLSMSVRDLLCWGQENLALYRSHTPVSGRDETRDSACPLLVSPQAARELHRPQTPIRAGEMGPYDTPFVDEYSYGFGWFVETYRGVPLIHHGGTTNGFKSIVSFMPEQDCVVAVLVNQNNSLLPSLVQRLVADAVLGADPYDWQGFFLGIAVDRRARTQQEFHTLIARGRRPLPSACAGTYTHPAYGTLRIMHDLDGPRLRYQHMSHRLRPGTKTPWVIDTGFMRQAIPCAFEGSPPVFHAWLEPELKTPIRFERVSDVQGQAELWVSAEASAELQAKSQPQPQAEPEPQPEPQPPTEPKPQKQRKSKSKGQRP